MNNEEALAALGTQEKTLREARDGLYEYERQVAAGNWATNIKGRKMDAIKDAALRSGVDLSAWDGRPAPVIP